MKTVKTFARQFSFGLMMAVTLGSAVVSCDSILDEDDVDCSCLLYTSPSPRDTR